MTMDDPTLDAVVAHFTNVPYIGDEAFDTFLKLHACPVDLSTVRLRFLSTMAYLGDAGDILPVLEELFERDLPEFSDGLEMLEFSRPFLGLWHELDRTLGQDLIILSPIPNAGSSDDLMTLLQLREEEVFIGFLEGIWDAEDEAVLTDVEAASLTALERASGKYSRLIQKRYSGSRAAWDGSVDDDLAEIIATDRIVEQLVRTVVDSLRVAPVGERSIRLRANALIDALEFTPGLPRDAINECIARKDEMVPLLLDELERQGSDGRDNALFFIIHILGELGEARTFAPLMKLLNSSANRTEDVLGDAVTENLPKILISTFDGDTALLYQLMNNETAGEFARNAAVEAWSYFVAAGQIDRTEAKDYLSSCFVKLQPREDNYVWIGWLYAISNLGFTELKDLVGKAYDIGLVFEGHITRGEFKDLVEAVAQTDDLVAHLKTENVEPFTSTIDVLSKWHGFSEEYLTAQKKAAQTKQPSLPKIGGEIPIINEFRDIGRNDLCPCGSGKKYKKCCLQ